MAIMARQQQGIGSRPNGQVDVGDPGRLRAPRVDDHQDFVRVLGHSREKSPGLGHLVALHAVPAHGHQHVGVLMSGAP